MVKSKKPKKRFRTTSSNADETLVDRYEHDITETLSTEYNFGNHIVLYQMSVNLLIIQGSFSTLTIFTTWNV